jgi:hypothetical protein
MKKRIIPIITVLSGMLLWGCYPDGPEYTEDMDVALTYHYPAYDFAARATYAMPDKIVKITGNLQEGDAPEFIPDATASQILTRVATNMAALGWQRVALDKNPDLVLTPASWEATTIYYYYDYWYWWYGGYYPPYGGYYPPVYYGGSYTTGTLILTMKDKTEVGGNGTPIQLWTGAINGLLNSKFNASRVMPLIDQLFTQSPYLKTN